MKAVILAAGKGERLSEIALNIPKPMINFMGKPILEHNIELCKRNGITEIFINTHYLPDVIINYFGDGARLGVSIQYSREKSPRGTAGAINSFRQFLERESFFVVYGDNYSNFDLKLLEVENETKIASGIIGFHWREDTSTSGVAEFADDGRIRRFLEKPNPGQSDSHWVNAGIYLLNHSVLNFIPEGYSDFAKDVFPRLLQANQPLYGVCSHADVKAFDTPAMYHKAFGDSGVNS
jgi:NDP-sugar pyrophosphorylase family protein